MKCRGVLSHRLPVHQRRTRVRVIAHHAAAQAVVALAGETLAAKETRVTAAFVSDVLALRVYALDEELYSPDVVARHQYPGGFLEALPDERQRERGCRLAQIRAAGLLLSVVRVEVEVPARLAHAVPWKPLSQSRQLIFVAVLVDTGDEDKSI